MFNFIRNLFQEKYKFLGALPDTRPEEEKALDVKFNEVVASADVVDWSNPYEPTYPIYDQGQACDCVAMTSAKLLGVYYLQKYQEWVDFSAGWVYWHRINKPDGGMGSWDVWNILKQKGANLEDLFPTKKTDIDIDNSKIYPHFYDVSKNFTIDTSIDLPVGDIDSVASVIQKTKKAVMVWYYFTANEWSLDEPVIYYPNLNINQALRHSVSAVGYKMINGTKYLIIDDSAWFGGIKRRYISEVFHRARNFYAGYFMNFKFEAPTQKPKYQFTKDLFFGMTDPDIKALQDILKYEGLLASNIQSTGYFGSLTLDAVKKFQVKYNIMPASGYVGPKTREILNQLYS